MKEVIKRDGTIVEFDRDRIVRAMTMAFKQSSGTVNNELVEKITTQIENMDNKRMHVEDIQDIVVKKLMASSEKDIAIAYQSYRAIKTEIRNKEKGIYKNIAELVDASNEDILSENANKDAKTISVQRDLLAGISSKDYYLNKILPKHLKKAHETGEIHIHDLDYLLFKETNCELVHIERMLKGGCNIGNAKMLEPNSVDVAVGHIVQIIASVPIPIVVKGVCPFTVEREFISYSNPCIACFTDSLVKSQLYSYANGYFSFNSILEYSIFPKIVYAMCEGLNMNEEDPNWDIAQLGFECMTKSIYPDILFITKEQLEKGTVVYPMGCRAFLSPWFNERGEEIYSGRFNIGATTINLPRIAIKNRGDEAGFYKELDRVMAMCKENSVFRAHYLEKTQAEMAPILWQSGALAEKQPKETIKDLIWGGYATVSIGYIGLSEVSQLLYGEDFAYNEEIYEKTFNILKYISEKVAQFKVETNLGFALYGTPSESLCDRFARIDREEFGDIEGITDKGYYDNSFHVSSHININPFEKLRLEALGHQYSKGGHISYIETDSLKNNLEAIIEILRYAKEIGIHYMGINQPVDKCHVCGFKGEFLATERGFECPQCGNHENDKMSVIRRVCGYLSQPNARPFNKGKQKEIISRVKHN